MHQIKKKKWLILFGGANREKIILSLLKSAKINISAIVIPDKLSVKLKKSINILKEQNLKILKTKRMNLETKIKKYSDDVLLSIGFPYILNKKILSSYKYKYNIHPTLLPKYRGPTSGANILINGDKYTGSTLHVMTNKVDVGKIIIQNKISISKFDNLRSMQNKTYIAEPKLVLQGLKKIISNKISYKQKFHKKIGYIKRRYPKDSEINPNKTLLELYDTIRACDPEEFPAFFKINKKKIYVKFFLSKKIKSKKKI